MSDPQTTAEPCKQPDRYDRGECGYPHCGCFDKPTETTKPKTAKLPFLCWIGFHQWHWIDITLPSDMGREECLCCGKQQVVCMDTH